jgi:hypothetical protein
MNILKNKIIITQSFKSKPSFLKFSSFNYNKRLTINKTMQKKNEKIVDDLFKMNDNTDFNTLALTLQSDLFHENLFQNLSNNII